jgi:hypothetical protein
VLILLRDPAETVTAEDIGKKVQCQVLRGSPSDSMLRVLQVCTDLTHLQTHLHDVLVRNGSLFVVNLLQVWSANTIF